jgi:(4S)-4-hydroxy-5-phosphonooxypentane-2,3-dione isomerase
MLTVMVSFKVKSADIPAFIEATLEDARTSLKDPGVVQMDLLQASDDAAHLALHEVFESRAVGLQHLEMAHFKQWQSTVMPLQVEPPHAVAYEHVLPKG